MVLRQSENMQVKNRLITTKVASLRIWGFNLPKSQTLFAPMANTVHACVYYAPLSGMYRTGGLMRWKSCQTSFFIKF